MKSLYDTGHRVIVLTGTVIGVNQTGMDYRINQLRSLGLEKNVHFSEVTICQGGSVEEVGVMKGMFCRDEGVALMIEDTDIYIESIKEQSPTTLNLRMR